VNKKIATRALFILLCNLPVVAHENTLSELGSHETSTGSENRHIEDDFFDALGVDQDSLDGMIKDQPDLIPAPKPSRAIVLLAKLYPVFSYCMKVKRGVQTRWKRFIAAVRRRYHASFSKTQPHASHEQS
jgi:hypothetical protein